MQKISKKAVDVLHFVKQFLPENPTVIEAGAFKGQDSLAISNFWPLATVHSFEPVPELFQELLLKTEFNKNIICYPVALGEITGRVKLHIAKRPNNDEVTQASCVLPPAERLSWSPFIYPETIEVASVTLDDWAKENKIPVVDFIWLDIQGLELAVLQNAMILLPTIKVIYCEVHFMTAYAEQPLYQEIKSWIESQGFVAVARDFDQEPSWFFGNVVFVRSFETSL